MKYFSLLALTLFVTTGCSSTPKEEAAPKKAPKSSATSARFTAEEGRTSFSVPTYFEGGMEDKDHDGVEDSKDQCTDTPIGVQVDEKGCAFDRDKDGVKDYEDACPDSMPHAKVKADGCADFVSFRLYYAPRVNEITPKSMLVLEKAVGFLQEHPEYKVRIIGYTETVGDGNYNMKLSQERAEDVLKLFNRKGINFNRLEAIGKGDSELIADNATDEGRELNRRIEVELYQ
ncbi:OmpA family protein [Sulfurimonas sp. HSL3-7]|uniref:OmpA family protein n=1 Tax=Sulfonitrofixus jiaomeiensis TaxID=3131938 RepID=UPI0031F74AC2